MGRSSVLLSVVVLASLGVAWSSVLRGGGGECADVTCTGVSPAECNLTCCKLDRNICSTAAKFPSSHEPDPSSGADEPDSAEAEYIVIHGGGLKMQELASDVAAKLGEKVQAGRVADPPCYGNESNERNNDWENFGVAVGEFSNGSPEILIRPEMLKDKNVVYITSINKPAEDFAQISTLYTLQRIPVPTGNHKEMKGEHYNYVYPKSLTVIVPNLPVARMERVSRWGLDANGKPVKEEAGGVVDVATARTMAGLLSARPPTGEAGAEGPQDRKVPSRILFIDIHEFNEMARFLTETGAWANEWSNDNNVMDLETGKGKYFVSVVPDFMADHKDELANTVIAFPDRGAFLRFNSMNAFKEHRAKNLMAYCTKTRNHNTVTLEYDTESPVENEGGVRGKEVIIIDDFTSSGSTLIASSRAMIKQGAKSVSIFVIHPVFDGKGYQKFFNAEKWDADAIAKLKKIYVTNSIPMNADAAEKFVAEDPRAEEFKEKFSVVKGSVAAAIATWVHDNVSGSGPTPPNDEYEAESIHGDSIEGHDVDVNDPSASDEISATPTESIDVKSCRVKNTKYTLGNSEEESVCDWGTAETCEKFRSEATGKHCCEARRNRAGELASCEDRAHVADEARREVSNKWAKENLLDPMDSAKFGESAVDDRVRKFDTDESIITSSEGIPAL